jgi:hypothetical protein
MFSKIGTHVNQFLKIYMVLLKKAVLNVFRKPMQYQMAAQ